MIKKPSGKWSICVDYTDLNKVYPKDSFPMPSIDQLVDNSSGFQLLSFMDAYSGYNQIPLHPDDHEKTAFITNKGNFCYNVMPFGLKNAGATYQRMMNRIFQGQIGRNLEVYIDDMIVKSLHMSAHITDLKETFEQLRARRIELNPTKCAFGVPAGKFLGFMLTNRGIEVNPDKCRAVLEMKQPESKKEIQQLTGRLAALTRFLPKSAEKALPFFKLLKKEAEFGWGEECKNAFENIKSCLATPPVLSKPEPEETLILYLSVGEEAISAALVRETDKSQQPIYFVGRTLQGPELRYQKLKKVAFALLTTARRLRPYFQSHRVIVRTNQPIRQVLHKPNLAGRMINWAVELSEFDIAYEPRQAIKSQALADFILELTPSNEKGKGNEDLWTIHVDGSSNSKGSGAGVIIETLEGVSIEHSLHLAFPTSNNQAEYEAFIAGIVQAKEHRARKIKIMSDSQLVTSQVEGKYQAKGPLMMKYLQQVKELLAEFDEVIIQYIPRNENNRADIFSKLASSKGSGNHCTVIQQSILELTCVMVITETEDWRRPIVAYLEKGILPDETQEARKLVRNSARFTIIEGQLYKKGFYRPMLKCLSKNEVEYVLAEIHEGINGHHMGGKALARKALRAGYYWPTMEADAKENVKRCEQCQKHALILRAPPEELQTITAPWPFFKWGMDLLGPFTVAEGQLKWLIVAVDYFTKWIEAEPLTTITSARIQRFFERNLISQFGLPAEIITDNRTQYADKKFQELMTDLKITHRFASVEHPQTNGQAESANKVIINGLKKRLFEAKGNWVQQLHLILWGYRTSAQSAAEETPSS
ncbi:uncharacterized protein LOC133296787 [Gastrolobium bilobum]|uniref:uncharacterized protein LOC133296787 n=1 Tax=Gastrolobium bilobum TaxID=150636 RepID=UPI002AB179B3|nr:uncharacterized protein LOC133296787 [Gastrolobium bilobum]